MPWFWITGGVDVADKLNCWKTDPIKVKSEIFKKKSDESQIFYETEIKCVQVLLCINLDK